MTFATAVPILFTSFVYRTNVYWSVIHGKKRKPHLSVVWNWYHFVAIAKPRPTDSADINTRLQLSDTNSIPPMHGGFLLISGLVLLHFVKNHKTAPYEIITCMINAMRYIRFSIFFQQELFPITMMYYNVCFL